MRLTSTLAGVLGCAVVLSAAESSAAPPESEPDVGIESDANLEGRPETEIQPDELPRSADDQLDEEFADPAPEESTPPSEEQRGASVEYDNGLLVTVNEWFRLVLNGLVQGRYTLNYRTDPPINADTMQLEKNVTQGFDVARARLTFGVGLTDFVSLVVRFGVVAGGSFTVQQAFIDLKWKYLRLRGGVFMNALIAESLVNPVNLYFADYSIVQNVFGPGSSKGVMLTYLRERFSLDAGYSDGLRTGFSEIRAPVNADYALTLRAQYAWGELGLTGFNQLNTRRGTPFGVRLGAGAHYQDGGRTQGSLPVRIALGTVDVVLRGSGWSVFLSGVVGQDAVDASSTGESGEVVVGGVTLMGGYFVLEDLQIFGQYSIATKPKIQGTLPPDIEAIVGPPSSFQAIGVGASYYLLPGRNNVKITTDLQYFIGRERGSLVPASPLNSIQVNDAGNQLAWRVQISGAF